MTPAVFCWSGGKDSSLCLYRVFQEKKFHVKYLLTTINQYFRRVSMHEVREELLEEQARAIGIPLVKMYVNEGTNAEYENRMKEQLLQFKTENVYHVIFGDIYLEDLRQYRENNLSKVGMTAVFPLWKANTQQLLLEFLSLNFNGIVCCTNEMFLGKEWVGRMIDYSFCNELPPQVDPCGENGEYHSFCFDGPIFNFPVQFLIGEKIYKPLEIKTNNSSTKQGFWYCDLLKKN
jgi:uncharacterized protein (TIGR00290 family)